MKTHDVIPLPLTHAKTNRTPHRTREDRTTNNGPGWYVLTKLTKQCYSSCCSYIGDVVAVISSIKSRQGVNEGHEN